jgi:hypothetical protein
LNEDLEALGACSPASGRANRRLHDEEFAAIIKAVDEHISKEVVANADGIARELNEVRSAS